MFKNVILFSVLTLLMGCQSYKQHITDTEVTYLRTSADSEPNSNDLAALIDPYKEQVSKEMEIVIGVLPSDISKKRPNSLMGNWFADILHDVAETETNEKVDFAIQNYGGLRIPFLSKGPITKGNIFELMPFDNKLIILNLTGNQVKTLCDMMAEKGGWPMSRGIEYTINEDKADMIKINGELISENETYSLALPDYVANGGGGGKFLIDIPQNDTGFFIRDIVIKHLEKLQKEGKDITIDSSKRIF